MAKHELSTIALLCIIFIAVAFIVTADDTGTHGEVYILSENTSFAIAAKDTYYPINGSVGGGNLNGVTLDSTNWLEINEAGSYLINGAISFSGQANTEYHGSVLINNVTTRSAKCHLARKLGTGGDVGNAGFTCIHTLAVDDRITMGIENKDNTGDIDIWDMNLNIVRLN